MTEVGRAWYQCVWKDSYGDQYGSRFYAVSDDAAVEVANAMAAVSGCKLDEFWKLVQLGPITTHAATAGANGRAKTWFHYLTTKRKQVKVSVPGFEKSLLELDGRKTAVDRPGGASRLTSANGTAIEKFVAGLGNYWNWKVDDTP